MSAVLETPTTVKTYLRPIDRDGLMAFAEKGRANPASRGTNKVHTVTEGQYRTLSYVGDHAPVVVDEPLHLFGQNTAPAPGEIVLSALGGCLAVGITAVATWEDACGDGLPGHPREGGGGGRCQPRGAGRDRAPRELLLARGQHDAQSDRLLDCDGGVGPWAHRWSCIARCRGIWMGRP